jgi:hypothetical protein
MSIWTSPRCSKHALNPVRAAISHKTSGLALPAESQPGNLGADRLASAIDPSVLC